MKPIHALVILLFLICPSSFLACVTREFPVTQAYQETQYRTEYTNETYTENNTSIKSDTGEFELHSYYSWHTVDLSYYGYEIPDSATYDNISLRFSIWGQLQAEPVMLRIFDMSKTGQISSPEPLLVEDVPQPLPDWYLIRGIASPDWLKTANTMINQAKFLGGSNYIWSQAADPQIVVLKAGKPASIAVLVSGPQNRWNSRFSIDVLWTRNIIEYSQAAKQRQVAHQVPYHVQKQRTVFQARQVPFWEAFSSP
jgi:hypothetical protein